MRLGFELGLGVGLGYALVQFVNQLITAVAYRFVLDRHQAAQHEKLEKSYAEAVKKFKKETGASEGGPKGQYL